MTLENQVVSLDLSKRLKELGFKNESLFYYSKNVPQAVDKDYNLYFDCVPDGKSSCGLLSDDEIKEQCYSAYTVAELGEMLPSNLSSFDVGEPSEYGSTWLTIEKDERSTIWFVSYENSNHQMFIPQFTEDTMANAMAKMLIYLKENNLI